MDVRKKIIVVFGSGKAAVGSEKYGLAYNIGMKLGKNGYILANGGYGGTMRAGAEGAAEANGDVIGVTCSAFGRNGPNEYVTREIGTKSLDERVGKLIEIGDGYIVLAGGTGTLLELANVWELKNKGFFERDKPIIIVGEFWDGLVSLVGSEDGRCVGHIEKAGNAEETIEILTRYFGKQD